MDLSAALRNQLTAHISELKRQISNLSRVIERQSGDLLNWTDAAVDLRQRLKDRLTNIEPRKTFYNRRK